MEITLKSYLEFLSKARDRFEFHLIKDFKSEQKNASIFLRHDVDLSLERALVMASVEAELGIASTYFVNLHSDAYNPLEIEQLGIMKSILSKGHDIGIHYDTEFYVAADRNCLADNLEEEKRILRYALDHEVCAFSFHNPTSQELDIKDFRIANLVNCYSSTIKSALSYISDSNGIWRFETPESIFQDSSRSYQILLHPGWWLDIEAEPIKKIWFLTLRRAFNRIRGYEDRLVKFGRQKRAPFDVNPQGKTGRLEKEILKLVELDSFSLADDEEI